MEPSKSRRMSFSQWCVAFWWLVADRPRASHLLLQWFVHGKDEAEGFESARKWPPSCCDTAGDTPARRV